MDPNEALRRIRELVRPGAERDDPDGSELSELVAGLDEWLSRGGFLPEAWRRADTMVPADDNTGRTVQIQAEAIGRLSEQLDEAREERRELVGQLSRDHRQLAERIDQLIARLPSPRPHYGPPVTIEALGPPNPAGVEVPDA